MKKAIVIGASSGIGRALAKILFQNGYELGVMARRLPLLEDLCNELGRDVFIGKIDAMDTDEAMRILEEFIEAMGGVDLVVISAGTGDVNENLDWFIEKETILTNATGFAALANVAVRHFMEKGSGHLVGISSVAALRGGKESPAYNASKAFMSNYLEGLRQKMFSAKLPITITDVKPGFVETAMAKGEGIFWAAPAEKAAMQIYRAISRKASHIYITRRWRLIAWLLKAMPGRLYERL